MTIIAERDDKAIKLGNNLIFVQYDLSENVFSVRSGNRWFLKAGHFEEGHALDAQITSIEDDLGAGKAIEVKYPSGCTYTLALYEDSPFVHIRTTITKYGCRAIGIRSPGDHKGSGER